MQGKTVLITGATSGIGKAAAIELAKQGATIILHGRDARRLNTTREQVQKASQSNKVDTLLGDLAQKSAIYEMVKNFKTRYDRLDILINNAAIIPGRRKVTAEGIELQLMVNYLAPFLLTHLLIETLERSAPARIINVSSDVHRNAALKLDDLQAKKNYLLLGWQQYSRTKLMTVLFTYELARHLEGTGVTANCLHPGLVATRLFRSIPGFSAFAKVLGLSPKRGAETVIYLASSPEVEGITGHYFEDKHPVYSAVASYDQTAATQLWQASMKLLNLP
jgi:NAD(P)-dependent dehydrogenase (short-subunit alcohol dehydrogenase family)